MMNELGRTLFWSALTPYHGRLNEIHAEDKVLLSLKIKSFIQEDVFFLYSFGEKSIASYLKSVKRIWLELNYSETETNRILKIIKIYKCLLHCPEFIKGFKLKNKSNSIFYEQIENLNKTIFTSEFKTLNNFQQLTIVECLENVERYKEACYLIFLFYITHEIEDDYLSLLSETISNFLKDSSSKEVEEYLLTISNLSRVNEESDRFKLVLKDMIEIEECKIIQLTVLYSQHSFLLEKFFLNFANRVVNLCIKKNLDYLSFFVFLNSLPEFEQKKLMKIFLDTFYLSQISCFFDFEDIHNILRNFYNFKKYISSENFNTQLDRESRFHLFLIFHFFPQMSNLELINTVVFPNLNFFYTMFNASKKSEDKSLALEIFDKMIEVLRNSSSEVKEQFKQEIENILFSLQGYVCKLSLVQLYLHFPFLFSKDAFNLTIDLFYPDVEMLNNCLDVNLIIPLVKYKYDRELEKSILKEFFSFFTVKNKNNLITRVAHNYIEDFNFIIKILDVKNFSFIKIFVRYIRTLKIKDISDKNFKTGERLNLFYYHLAFPSLDLTPYYSQLSNIIFNQFLYENNTCCTLDIFTLMMKAIIEFPSSQDFFFKVHKKMPSLEKEFFLDLNYFISIRINHEDNLTLKFFDFFLSLKRRRECVTLLVEIDQEKIFEYLRVYSKRNEDYLVNYLQNIKSFLKNVKSPNLKENWSRILAFSLNQCSYEISLEKIEVYKKVGEKKFRQLIDFLEGIKQLSDQYELFEFLITSSEQTANEYQQLFVTYSHLNVSLKIELYKLFLITPIENHHAIFEIFYQNRGEGFYLDNVLQLCQLPQLNTSLKLYPINFIFLFFNEISKASIKIAPDKIQDWTYRFIDLMNQTPLKKYSVLKTIILSLSEKNEAGKKEILKYMTENFHLSFSNYEDLVRFRNSKNQNFLHLCALKGDLDLIEKIYIHYREETLILKGERDTYGMSPLDIWLAYPAKNLKALWMLRQPRQYSHEILTLLEEHAFSPLFADSANLLFDRIIQRDSSFKETDDLKEVVQILLNHPDQKLVNDLLLWEFKLNGSLPLESSFIKFLFSCDLSHVRTRLILQSHPHHEEIITAIKFRKLDDSFPLKTDFFKMDQAEQFIFLNRAMLLRERAALPIANHFIKMFDQGLLIDEKFILESLKLYQKIHMVGSSKLHERIISIYETKQTSKKVKIECLKTLYEIEIDPYNKSRKTFFLKILKNNNDDLIVCECIRGLSKYIYNKDDALEIISNLIQEIYIKKTSLHFSLVHLAALIPHEKALRVAYNLVNDLSFETHSEVYSVKGSAHLFAFDYAKNSKEKMLFKIQQRLLQIYRPALIAKAAYEFTRLTGLKPRHNEFNPISYYTEQFSLLENLTRQFSTVMFLPPGTIGVRGLCERKGAILKAAALTEVLAMGSGSADLTHLTVYNEATWIKLPQPQVFSTISWKIVNDYYLDKNGYILTIPAEIYNEMQINGNLRIEAEENVANFVFLQRLPVTQMSHLLVPSNEKLKIESLIYSVANKYEVKIDFKPNNLQKIAARNLTQSVGFHEPVKNKITYYDSGHIHSSFLSLKETLPTKELIIEENCLRYLMLKMLSSCIQDPVLKEAFKNPKDPEPIVYRELTR